MVREPRQEATVGEQGLRLVERTRPDVALLDLCLSGREAK